MTSPSAPFKDLYSISKLNEAAFTASTPEHPRWGRTYGGQILAQSIRAALETVDSSTQYLHNIQSQFISSGREDLPLIYDITVLKTTRAFSTRRVDVLQDLPATDTSPTRRVVVSSSFLSFTILEPNFYEHVMDGLDTRGLPHPDTLPDLTEEYQSLIRNPVIVPSQQRIIAGALACVPFRIKVITREDMEPRRWTHGTRPVDELTTPRKLYYMKFPQRLVDSLGVSVDESSLQTLPDKYTDPDYHQFVVAPSTHTRIHVSKIPTSSHNGGDPSSAKTVQASPTHNTIDLSTHLNILALAYMSDFGIIEVCLKSQPLSYLPANIQFATLNHSITIVQPTFSVDDWLVMDISSKLMSHSKTVLTGTFYSAKTGHALAFFTQETLARVHDASVIGKYPNPVINTKSNDLPHLVAPSSSASTGVANGNRQDEHRGAHINAKL